MGDGNGWVICSHGHQHWGRFGAAGLLLRDGGEVLLQHRAAWTHEGGSWAVPGGARDSHESPVAAALREATEETSLDPAAVVPAEEWVDDHGGWSYTTVTATLRAGHGGAHRHVRSINAESDEMRWWPVEAVADLHLHHGFAAAWPTLRQLLDAEPPAQRS